MAATDTKGETIFGGIQILKYEREWLEDTAEMSSLKKFLDEPETLELCASEQERGRLKKGGDEKNTKGELKHVLKMASMQMRWRERLGWF